MEAGTSCGGGEANYVGEEESFETRIKSNLIGQESAITLVASAIRQKQIGQSNKGRPLVLLFLGPPGVGKTELTKQVAQCIHGDDEIGLIPLHMHGYQDRDSVEDMFGSPPGDNWHEHYGVLAQALRLRKNAVILLEEIEFAHPAVLSALLRMFNEGHFVTGHGQTIESRHAIFIMTSKLASEAICQQGKQLMAEQEALHGEPLERTVTRGLSVLDASHGQAITLSSEFELKFVRPILEEHFCDRSAGFLDRIDHLVQFLPFSASETRMLVQKELEYWKAVGNQKSGVELSWDPMVVDSIATESGLEFGARTIKRDVDERIVDKINRKLCKSRYPTKKVHISVCKASDANGYRYFNFRSSQ